MLRKLILATAATALVVTPVAPQAAPVRTASPVAEEEELGGALLPVIVFVALGLLLILVVDSSEEPTSP